MDGSGNTVNQGLSAGQILHCPWGYSMVLNSYYRVVKGAAIGKMAKIQKIRSKNVSHDGYGQAGYEEPDLEAPAEGALMTCRVRLGYRDTVSVKTDHGYASAWDGKPDHFDTYD